MSGKAAAVAIWALALAMIAAVGVLTSSAGRDMLDIHSDNGAAVP